jgi:hypothetical protein
MWIVASGAALAGGAYLLYSAWSDADRKDKEDGDEPASQPESSAPMTPPRGQALPVGGSPASQASGIVKEMLSQDVLLTPLRVRESHYTRLLAEHAAKGHIPEEEVRQYRQQYGIVRQLTHVLETQPENTEHILHLMQMLQDSGDPPPDPSSDPRLSLSPHSNPRLSFSPLHYT